MSARARILVVEDEPRLGELLRLYLERDGHTVTVVARRSRGDRGVRRGRRPTWSSST